MPGDALILAAHGSREEPAANQRVRRLVASLAEISGFAELTAAFHLGRPSFDEVLDRLSATRVVVVPYMTSEGYFSQVVLPLGLARNRRYRELSLVQTRPLGVHPGVPNVVARRLARLGARLRLDARRLAVVLVGHGTRRHTQSRAATLAVAAELQRRLPPCEVRPAFLDDEPVVEEVFARVRSTHVVVLPFLVTPGAHAAADLPTRLGLVPRRVAKGLPLCTSAGDRRVVVDRPVGCDPGMAALVMELAAEASDQLTARTCCQEHAA